MLHMSIHWWLVSVTNVTRQQSPLFRYRLAGPFHRHHITAPSDLHPKGRPGERDACSLRCDYSEVPSLRARLTQNQPIHTPQPSGDGTPLED
jgi:hypothetical protein